MNWLDVVFGLIIVASIARGVQKGIVRMGIGMIATVVGLVLALMNYRAAGNIFTDWVSSRLVANFLGFMLVFLAIILLGSIVARTMTKMFKWIGLGWFNRLMGGVFGLLRGALVATVLLMVFMAFAPGNPPKSVYDSSISPYLMEFADVISAVAPDDLRGKFKDGYGKVKQNYWDPVEKKVSEDEAGAKKSEKELEPAGKEKMPKKLEPKTLEPKTLEKVKQ